MHPNQIRQWRQKLVDDLPELFSDRRQKNDKEAEEVTSELYRQIGQLKVELDRLKKITTATIEEKRTMIELVWENWTVVVIKRLHNEGKEKQHDHKT